MASRILGMGDMLSLIEKAEASFDQEKAEKLETVSYTHLYYIRQRWQLKRYLLSNSPQFPLSDFLTYPPRAVESSLEEGAL